MSACGCQPHPHGWLYCCGEHFVDYLDRLRLTDALSLHACPGRHETYPCPYNGCAI